MTKSASFQVSWFTLLLQQRLAKHGLQKAARWGRFAAACLHCKLHELDVGANIDIVAMHLYSAVVEPVSLNGREACLDRTVTRNWQIMLTTATLQLNKYNVTSCGTC
jgi:hypothetical protein